MDILMVHNWYQQIGGEGISFEAEADLLEQHNVGVVRYTLHNDRIDSMGAAALARTTLWNLDAYHAVSHLIRKHRIDLVHVHNAFPLISPSVYYAAHAQNAAVVQTLHNYRLLCPTATFFRNGQPCEDCLNRTPPWPGVWHACYRDSHVASAGVATMLTMHRLINTWTRQIDRYVALTPFARDKFIEGGLPCNRLAVKPNFIYPDPGMGTDPRGSALFVGRLSPEKGVNVLIDAWKQLEIPLKVVGTGPLTSDVIQASTNDSSIEVMGYQKPATVMKLLQRSKALIVPSLCYETFGRTIIEAFATGTPVIASDRGAMRSLIDHEHTGLLFRPGDPNDLADTVRWLWQHPDERAAMGRAARAEYEAKYTAERNYEILMQIYEDALRHRRQVSS